MQVDVSIRSLLLLFIGQSSVRDNCSINFYFYFSEVVNIIISLITWILLTFNASLAISQGEGLGCVDAFTETVMPSHNLKVFKERDGWVPSSRSKFNLFPSKEK